VLVSVVSSSVCDASSRAFDGPGPGSFGGGIKFQCAEDVG